MPQPFQIARALAALAAAMFSAAPGLVPVRAQTLDGIAGSFVTPFPDKDTYRVQTYGDGVAEGLAAGLAEALADEQRIQLQRRHRAIGSLWRADFEEEAKALETELGRDAPHIAVIGMGLGDRQPWRQPNGRRIAVGAPEWRTEYARRVDRVVRAFRAKSVAVYWVGHPIQRRSDVSDEAQLMNDILRDRSSASGARFIDVYRSFADEQGDFNAWGPDVAGKSRRLRDQDSGAYTFAGYRKLAFFVERELKRDVASARNERTIPLAGSEAEQQRVRGAKALPAPVLTGAATPKAAVAAGPAAAGARPAPAPSSGDLPADTAMVTVYAVAQGREEKSRIEIVRPAIPASVLAAVTRRESVDKASHVGDPLMAEVLGGLTMISSVTPAAEAAGVPGDRRRLTTTNTPYFRVLVRGERLTPRPGRADEMPWPRQELLPAGKAEQSPVSAEPSAAPAARPAPRAPAQRG